MTTLWRRKGRRKAVSHSTLDGLGVGGGGGGGRGREVGGGGGRGGEDGREIGGVDSTTLDLSISGTPPLFVIVFIE